MQRTVYIKTVFVVSMYSFLVYFYIIDPKFMSIYSLILFFLLKNLIFFFVLFSVKMLVAFKKHFKFVLLN